MSDEKYKCIVCGKEKTILVSVISQIDAGELFFHSRGICQDCLLKGDLNKICLDTQENKIKDTIKKFKSNLGFWEGELIKFNKEKNGK